MLSSASNFGEQVNTAFALFLAICVGLLVLITALMVVFVIKYDRKRHPTPAPTTGNTLLEIIWTVVPTILVIGMFYFGWAGYSSLVKGPENAMKVTVTGRMWSWSFTYANGVQSDVLRLPVGKDIELTLASMDVVHSFYVPAFRFKHDLVPGEKSRVWFTPVDTGTFDVFCAEYCGDRHSYMRTNVVVMQDSAFDTWLARAGERMNTGAAAAVEKTGAGETDRLSQRGLKLVESEGCIACHSLDGSVVIGPSFKGLFGSVTTVLENGTEKQVPVDEAYVRRSILQPEAEIVKGFKPLMPTQQGVLNEDKLKAIVAFIESIGVRDE
jgi:cytochrome c oxidase subunit 2